MGLAQPNLSHEVESKGGCPAPLVGFLELVIASDHDPENARRLEGLEQAVSQWRSEHEQPHAHLLITGMAKSGSTWLCRLLERLSGYQTTPLLFAYFQNEHDLYLPGLLGALGKRTLTQQHVRATDVNLVLMRAFGLSPVVLVRRLDDVAVSLWEHLLRLRTQIPHAYFGPEFRKWPANLQLDAVVRLAMPSFVSAYASWAACEREGLLPFLWLTYEELVASPLSSLRRVCDFCGVDVSNEQFGAALSAVDSAQSGLNRGVVGRGKEVLSDSQQDYLRGLTELYPQVDFFRVGF